MLITFYSHKQIYIDFLDIGIIIVQVLGAEKQCWILLHFISDPILKLIEEMYS
jgi:hypothetical protein